MTNRNNNSLNMYLAVQIIIAKFVAIWTGLTSMEVSNTEFNGFVDKIMTNLELQKQLLKGYALEKKAKKSAMAKAASILCRKVRSYATATKNNELAGKMKINFSMLYYAGSSTSIIFANNIVSAATAMTAAEKTTYGITIAEIDLVKELKNNFASYSAIPRSEIVGRAFATKEVNDSFKAASRLLIDSMDNIMANFEESNPEFYAQYKYARRIVDLQRHTVLEGNVTDEGGVDLKKVKVTIVGKDKVTNEEKVVFEEVTDKNGNYAKSEINPEFDYDITFSLPSYVPVTKTGVDIARGEHELVDVQLVKIPVP